MFVQCLAHSPLWRVTRSATQVSHAYSKPDQQQKHNKYLSFWVQTNFFERPMVKGCVEGSLWQTGPLSLTSTVKTTFCANQLMQIADDRLEERYMYVSFNLQTVFIFVQSFRCVISLNKISEILWSPYRLMNYLPSVFQPYYAATLSVPFVRTCVNRFSHFTWYIQ